MPKISIGHLLQNGSLKLNLIKLFLLFFITHTGGTPTHNYQFFDILSVPQEPACVILTLLGFFILCPFKIHYLQNYNSFLCIAYCEQIFKFHVLHTHTLWMNIAAITKAFTKAIDFFYNSSLSAKSWQDHASINIRVFL